MWREVRGGEERRSMKVIHLRGEGKGNGEEGGGRGGVGGGLEGRLRGEEKVRCGKRVGEGGEEKVGWGTGREWRGEERKGRMGEKKR